MGSIARGPLAICAAAAVSIALAGCPVRQTDEQPSVPLDGGVTVDGGTLDTLKFAVVGDTRPADIDNTGGYPTGIISTIWRKVEAHRPVFAVTTGDYMYAAADGSEGAKQLDLYLGAQAAYKGVVWHVLGNHECSGWTNSNCGPGSSGGTTSNYAAFMEKFQAPEGLASPYYTVSYAASDDSWSVRFVVIAANAWSASQEDWLDTEMKNSSTYTFVLRHMDSSVAKAPGVTPSNLILHGKSWTILIAGHAHTYRHQASTRELIVGNGGAPLSGGFYGYVIAVRRGDGAIEFTAYDYASDAAVDRFAVNADGSPAD